MSALTTWEHVHDTHTHTYESGNHSFVHVCACLYSLYGSQHSNVEEHAMHSDDDNDKKIHGGTVFYVFQYTHDASIILAQHPISPHSHQAQKNKRRQKGAKKSKTT